MGISASSQRRSRGESVPPLDRTQPLRQSLRSIGRKSQADKIARTSSNQSLPASRSVTLCNTPDSEVTENRNKITNRSSVDQTLLTSSRPKTPSRCAESPSIRSLRRSAAELPNRHVTDVNNTPDRWNGNHRQDEAAFSSPFSLISSQEAENLDEDFRSVNDFLSKHYSVSDGQRNLTRVSRQSERHNGRAGESRRRLYVANGNSFNLCDLEYNRSHAEAKDELNELNAIDCKLNSLISQERLSSESGEKSCKVSFTLSNGSEQETHLVPLAKASALIAERKSYLVKKIDLEASHCRRVRQIFASSETLSPEPDSSPPVTNTTPAATLISTPSFSKTRKPRALSLIESADGIVGLDASSYANLMQDVKELKTLLFRLQGCIHNGGDSDQQYTYLNSQQR